MSDKIVYCSFCGKSQHEVRKLIAWHSTYICDECVGLCNDIIDEELGETGRLGATDTFAFFSKEELDLIEKHTDLDIQVLLQNLQMSLPKGVNLRQLLIALEGMIKREAVKAFSKEAAELREKQTSLEESINTLNGRKSKNTEPDLTESQWEDLSGTFRKPEYMEIVKLLRERCNKPITGHLLPFKCGKDYENFQSNLRNRDLGIRFGIIKEDKQHGGPMQEEDTFFSKRFHFFAL